MSVSDVIARKQAGKLKPEYTQMVSGVLLQASKTNSILNRTEKAVRNEEPLITSEAN